MLSLCLPLCAFILLLHVLTSRRGWEVKLRAGGDEVELSFTLPVDGPWQDASRTIKAVWHFERKRIDDFFNGIIFSS